MSKFTEYIVSQFGRAAGFENITIQRVILDASFCVKMGMFTPVFREVFFDHAEVWESKNYQQKI